MTGGSMQNKLRDPMSLSKHMEMNFRTVHSKKQPDLQLIIPACVVPIKLRLTTWRKKQVKKPNGGKPGFVVYYTNYSMVIDSDISNIEELE